jgi:RND family efflux transporter MFP subunit
MNIEHRTSNLEHRTKWIRTWLLISMFGLQAVHADDILGYTEPYKIITVSASEPGVLAELLVEEGVNVKKNQVLARLDVAALSAELEIAKAEAQLQATRKQRLVELAQSSRATTDELDKAKTDFVIKEAQVRKTEAMIESRTMRSPVDGIVTEIKRDPSESVSVANPHVLTVVQIDKLTVNLFLPPATALQFKPGGMAHLRFEDGAPRVPATVEYISPVTDSASGTVRVKFAIDNAARQHRAGARCTLAAEPAPGS